MGTVHRPAAGRADVAPDLPGHGSRVGEQFTREAALATIEEAVAGSDPGRPVVLAGHSLGGYLSTLYAAAHPDALAALVLLGASADPRGRLAVVYRAFAEVPPHVDPARMAQFANLVMRGLGVSRTAADALPDGRAFAALPAAWGSVSPRCSAGSCTLPSRVRRGSSATGRQGGRTE